MWKNPILQQGGVSILIFWSSKNGWLEGINFNCHHTSNHMQDFFSCLRTISSEKCRHKNTSKNLKQTWRSPGQSSLNALSGWLAQKDLYPPFPNRKLGKHVLRGFLAKIKSFQFKETLENIWIIRTAGIF